MVPESREQAEVAGHDWTGTVLSGLGMGALVFGLIEGSWFGWWPALIVVFVLWEIPGPAAEQITRVVKESAGIAIADLQANPDQEVAAGAATAPAR